MQGSSIGGNPELSNLEGLPQGIVTIDGVLSVSGGRLRDPVGLPVTDSAIVAPGCYLARVSFPGGLGTKLARRDGASPIWSIPSARGPATLSLEHDGLLDRDDVFLEDNFFPQAADHVERVVNFLRARRHEALPRYVDDWVARDQTIHQYSATSGWSGAVHHLLTLRRPGISGLRYLQGRRARGAGLPPVVALRIVERLADACRLAHADGVVHGGILLDHAVRVHANGRPILERWTCGRRAVGNVGCDSEGLWSGIRDLLGGEVPSPRPVGDVFALGSLLALLVTGGAAYERGPRRAQYCPPSARDPAFAWLDEAVGLACDPSRGFSLSAGALAVRLAALLAAMRPSMQRVREDLELGDFRSLAEFVAASPEPRVGPLASAVCTAVERHVLGAIDAQRAVPVFSELLLATCPEAMPLVRAYARAPERSPWGRHVASRLLAAVDDPDTLPIALAAGLDGWAAPLGWSARPELVDADGAPCPHPWTSLVGEPFTDEHGELQRECRRCGGPVRSARAWLDARWRRSLPGPWDHSGFPRLVVTTATGTHERELWPGSPQGLGSEPDETLSVAGLDPADHAKITAIDRLRVVFTFGVYRLGYLDGSELRASLLDTRETGASLELGPLRFEASAPGRISVHAAAGVPLAVVARRPEHAPSERVETTP